MEWVQKKKLKHALEAPLFKIAESTGMEGAVVVNKVKESKDGLNGKE